jgi:hypothetical protein
MIRLVLYPGEVQDGSTTRGHLYVYVDDKLAAQYPACGGPAGAPHPDRGGHTASETPAGSYVLGAAQHHVSGSWPLSAIPFGAQLRKRSDGDTEWSVDGITWRPATGPEGTLTLAGIVFRARSERRWLTDSERQEVVAQYRWLMSGNPDPTYRQNDFGEWAWNLNQPLGRWTSYFVHTTPEDEAATAGGGPISLANSHGCVHIRPVDRDQMMQRGWLACGVPFTVENYGKVGPVGLT